MSNNEENLKKKRLRLPMIAKITLLFVFAAVLGSFLVFFISKNIRMKRAMEQGGEIALNGCMIADMLLDMWDPDLSITATTTSHDPAEDKTRDYVRQELTKYFENICSTLKLKYLYLFTVDEDKVRHHIISVASDPEENEKLKSIAGYGSTSDDPLDENEIKALNNEAQENPYYVTKNSYGYVCTCVIPATNVEGKAVAIIGADCDMSAIMEVYNTNQNLLYLLVTLFCVIMLIISAVLLHFTVIRPARILSKTMRRFANDPNTEITKRKVMFTDEISDMEHSFRVMAGDIREYIGNIEKLTKDKIQADVQMEDAQRIQRGMVPPETQLQDKNFSFYAVMNPALEVGGDFYDAFTLQDGRFAFLIGDVSGKGISAALFMAMTKRIMRDRLISTGDPAQALTEANRDVYNENPEGLFATIFAVIYDPWTGKIVYSNAGHTDPVFFGSNNEMIRVDTAGLLGVFDDTVYTAEERYLKKGEGIFLYTDGTTEAVNTDRVAYGEERLLQQFNDEKGKPSLIVKKIRDSVIEFEGEAGLFDDLTMLSLCRMSEGFIMGEEDLKPDLAELPKLRKLLFDELNNNERTREIMVAAEEWVVNLISYSGTEYIHITMEYDGNSEDDNSKPVLILEFRDNGVSFDPVTYTPKEKEFEDLMFGGMGIGIVKEKTKQLTWERKNENNIVRMYFDYESFGSEVFRK